MLALYIEPNDSSQWSPFFTVNHVLQWVEVVSKPKHIEILFLLFIFQLHVFSKLSGELTNLSPVQARFDKQCMG